jgi:hypothetical protein
MKRFALFAGMMTIALSLAGCNTCRQMTGGWFNRGDKCNVCPPAGCAPGMPQTQMMLPSTPQVLPGPIEIAPLP